MARRELGKVLSETAGASGLQPALSARKLNVLHRWVETDFRDHPYWGGHPRDRFEPRMCVSASHGRALESVAPARATG